jgi:hypothetical protein
MMHLLIFHRQRFDTIQIDIECRYVNIKNQIDHGIEYW